MALKLYLDSDATEEITDSNPDELKQAVESGTGIENEINLYLKSDDDSLTYENITIEEISIADDWESDTDYVERDGDADEPADYVIGSDDEIYKCTQDHTSSNDDEPTTGSNWENYWKQVKSVDISYSAHNEVVDEIFTSNYDTAVSLDNSNLDTETTVYVTSTDDGETSSEEFEEDTDFEIDYENGEITVLSDGSMDDDTEYYIDYAYKSYSDPLNLSDGKYDTSKKLWRKSDILDIAEAFIREDIRHRITADEYID